MEANIQLIRIIQEMQAEINILEKENQALYRRLTSRSQGAWDFRGESEDEREEEARGQSPTTLHPGVCNDLTPAVQEHQGNVMIVRRYSLSSAVDLFAANDPWKSRESHPNSGIIGIHGTATSLTCSSTEKQDKGGKMLAAGSFSNSSFSPHASPEHVFGCRDKIKTVSFLLPMDTSYSENSSSLKCSPNQTTKQLSIILE